ncbi:MAG: peptidase M50 [Bacillota bacterium]|nr:MAG: peptidase M50 [Bacillota bacterium]
MRLAALFGIRFSVNVWFLLLLLAAAWAGRLTEAVTVFAVVLLHEIGHIVAARGYGIQVAEVELLPFGGVARLDGLLEADPSVEAGIAIAGPLTNAVLLGLGALAWRYELFPPSWALFFIGTNAAIAGFNLLPALPLDGGRLFRAYRSRRIGYRRATHQAVRLGQCLGAVLVLAGAGFVYWGYASITMPLVGLFVVLAARREAEAAGYVFMASLVRKQQELEAHGCLAAEALVARADAPVRQVVDRFVPQRYHLVWVVDEAGRPTGIAAEADILDCLFDRGLNVPVAEAVQLRYIDNKR